MKNGYSRVRDAKTWIFLASRKKHVRADIRLRMYQIRHVQPTVVIVIGGCLHAAVDLPLLKHCSCSIYNSRCCLTAFKDSFESRLLINQNSLILSCNLFSSSVECARSLALNSSLRPSTMISFCSSVIPSQF